MQISIVGTGAMASLFAARLSHVAAVSMIGSWAAAIEAIRAHGITIDGETCCRGMHAAYHPDEAPAADVAIVLTKAYKTPVAAEVAARTLAPQGLALTLQNGLGNLAILSQQVGADRALQGVTMQGATLLAPGRLRTSGRGATHLGCAPGGRSPSRDAPAHRLAQEIADLLNAAGLKAQLSPDIDGVVWDKVIVNAAINPLTAILRVRNGALLESPATLEYMRAVAAEAAAVAAALGVRLPYADPLDRVKYVAELTATNHSSMLQDVLTRRQTEVDAINGRIVEYGQARGVPTPLNAALTARIHELQSSYTPEVAEKVRKELARSIDAAA